MEKKNVLIVFSIIVLGLLYATVLIGLSIDDYHTYFIPGVPILYLITGLTLLYFHKGWSPNFLLFLLIILVVSFIVQVAAVKTGLIYGHYKYGSTLGPQFLGVPLIAILNKFVLLYCVGLFVKSLNIKQIFLASLLGASIMLLINILAEPVAIFLKFREWSEQMFVLHNYGARFVVAFAFLFLFNSMKFPKRNEMYLPIFIMEILFFMIINFMV